MLLCFTVFFVDFSVSEGSRACILLVLAYVEMHLVKLDFGGLEVDFLSIRQRSKNLHLSVVLQEQNLDSRDGFTTKLDIENAVSGQQFWRLDKNPNHEMS